MYSDVDNNMGYNKPKPRCNICGVDIVKGVNSYEDRTRICKKCRCNQIVESRKIKRMLDYKKKFRKGIEEIRKNKKYYEEDLLLDDGLTDIERYW